MSDSQQITKAKFGQEIVKMAVEDKAFRQQLVANPKQALKSAIGFEPPPGVDLQVLQESPTRMYLVLPADAAISTEGRELGDDELAAVAGGAFGQQLGAFASGDFAKRLGNEVLRPGSGLPSPGSLVGISVKWG